MGGRGLKGYAIHEWFEIRTPNINFILNGYQSTLDIWRKNSRVKTLKIYVEGKPLCILHLQDVMQAQIFELPEFNSPKDDDPIFRFEILDIYKGNKWSDTAISEIGFSACCMAADTEVMCSTDILGKIRNGSRIKTIDPSTGKTMESIVERMGHSHHSK